MPEGDRQRSDRRRHKRLKKPFSLRIQVQFAAAAGPWDMVLVKDISRSGLSFTYDRPLKVGDRLAMKINFGFEPGTIQCMGEVVRAQESGKTKFYDIGVKYVDISESSSELIDRAALEFHSNKT